MRWAVLLILLTLSSGFSRSRWQGALELSVQVDDRHTGYAANEPVTEPRGTWQLLFSALVPAPEELRLKRLCVWLRVPEETKKGVLRLVPLERAASCRSADQAPALLEETGLRTFQYSLRAEEFELWVGTKENRVVPLKLRFLNLARPPGTELRSPSTPTRTVPGVFLFAPNAGVRTSSAKLLQGEITDEYPAGRCRWDDGSCRRCRYGVYRVSAGAEAEYYCGVDRCGEQNRPACWRGTRWPHVRADYSCRTSEQQVYCAPGLKVECVGEQALCR